MEVEHQNLEISHYWKEGEKDGDVRESPIFEQLPWSAWTSHRKVIHDVQDLSPDVAKACKSQLDFIEHLKGKWHGIAIPRAWKPFPGQNDQLPGLYGILSIRIEKWLDLLQEEIQYLEDEDVRDLVWNSLETFKPNFLHSESPVTSSTSILDATQLSFSAFNDILDHNAQERSAEFVVPCIFQKVPGCRLICHPQFDFPSCMSAEFNTRCIDFALFLNPTMTSGENGDEAGDHHNVNQIRVSMLHPALLVGVKGPTPWDDNPNIIYTSRTIQLQTMDECQKILYQAVESSLYGLVVNTQVDDSHRIPEWSRMIFGVMYDANAVHIVAHIPYEIPNKDGQASLYSYISCIVDTISYRGGLPCDRASALDRFRVAMALLCLRSHAEFLATKLSPSASWSPDVVEAAKSVRSLYLPVEESTESMALFSVSSPDQGVSAEQRRRQLLELNQSAKLLV